MAAVVVAAVVVLAAGAAIGFLATSRGSGAAGNPPTFSALSTTPALASVPGAVKSFLEDAAPAVGVSETTLDSRVHLLRSSMGPNSLKAYAFVDNQGRPCIDVPTEAGICGTSPRTRTPGFYWMIGGGNEGDTSASLIGLAGDNVQSVALTVDGKKVPVSVKNEIAFAQYPTSAQTATVTVSYVNGSQATDSLPLH